MASGSTLFGGASAGVGLGIALVASLMALPAWGADFEEHVAFNDLYLSYGMTPSPTVEERTTSTSGTGSTYEWKDQAESFGHRIAVGSLNGSGENWGGWVWGGEVAGVLYDITPERYRVSGADQLNTSGATLRYRTVGVTLLGGYEYGITSETEGINAFLTLTPFIGGGGAWADNELHYANGTYERKRGSGWYLEYGLRAGFHLTEDHWVFGVNLEYLFGTGKVAMDFPGGYSSELTLDRLGIGGNAIIGYRF